MPKLKLTKTGVNKLPYFQPSSVHPKKNQEIYWDTEMIGFGLRITGTSKTYIVEKRVNRRTVRARIGGHKQIPTDKARKMAQKLIYEMTTGKDINARKRATEGESITLNQAFRDFLEKRELKERTIWDYQRAIDISFKSWKRKRIIDITREMVSRHHKKLGDQIGKAQANQSMRFLRSLINFAAGQYEDGDGKPLIPLNPVLIINQTRTWYRVERRQTIIKNHELAPWFEAVESLSGNLVKDYLKILLFTGLRRQEAMKLRWDQVNFKAKTFTVIDTKNRNPLTLPFGTFILKLLKDRKQQAVDSPFVFPGTGKTGHLVESKYQTAQVIKLSGIKFCLHDLRRVFINCAESLDISSYAVKQLVNHSSGGDVTAGYLVSDPERLRKPMERIETHLLRLCRKDKAKVVNIK